MRKLAVFCLLIFILFPSRVWSQPHEVASQHAVSLAMMNTWPNLPSPAQITEAYNVYKSKLGKNVTITSGPSRMSAPWENDPLYANKVVLTIRADYTPRPSRDMAVVLKYDFMSAKFKFEGVILQGVKRYKGDKNTASYLEPQDLKYLKTGWILYPDRKRPHAGAGVNDVANVVEEYIRQFKGKATCFGRVVELGDPAKYREELNRDLTVITQSRELSKGALASHKDFKVSWAVTPKPPCELHVPFLIPLRPQKGELPFGNMQTLHHEATHHIEWRHGVKRARGTPGAERNTDYLDNLVKALKMWKKFEQEVITGARTPEEAQVAYGILEDEFSRLQKEFQPDLVWLEKFAGIRIRIEDIRNLYLGEGCGVALREVVENYLVNQDSGSEPRVLMTTRSPDPNKPVAAVRTPDPGHIVYAMIYDNNNGQPVEGAAFTILRPGVTTQKWISSEFNMELVAAMGVSDKSGMVVLSKSLEKGKTYSLMVARQSYEVVRHETLSITEASPDPLKITVKLKR